MRGHKQTQLHRPQIHPATTPATHPVSPAKAKPAAKTPKPAAKPIAKPVASPIKAQVSGPQAQCSSDHGFFADVRLASASIASAVASITADIGKLVVQLKAPPGNASINASAATVAAKNSTLSSVLNVLGADASVGTQNADGSVGAHANFGAQVAGFEATVSVPNFSLTIGFGEGVGGELSIGVRDADQDGRLEVCARASLASVFGLLIGVCFETPFGVAAL